MDTPMGDKQRARDGEGKLIKEPQPNPKEMIDPYVFKKTGRAINYDCRWAGSTQLGNTVGVWASTPWNRTGHGPIMQAYWEELREKNQIPWKEHCFFFTHAQGKAARVAYEIKVLKGELKANKKSWSNKHADFTGVSFEDLEKGDYSSLKQEYRPQVGEVNTATIKDQYKKTTSTYVNKDTKKKMVSDAMEDMEITEENALANIGKLAEHTNLDAGEIAKLLIEMLEKDGDESEDEEITSYEEPMLDFDELDEPTAEELEQVTEDYKLPEDSEIAIDEDGDIQIHVEEGTSIAAITATDDAVTPLITDIPVMLRAFSDASTVKIEKKSTDVEAIEFSDGVKLYLFELPDGTFISSSAGTVFLGRDESEIKKYNVVVNQV